MPKSKRASETNEASPAPADSAPQVSPLDVGGPTTYEHWRAPVAEGARELSYELETPRAPVARERLDSVSLPGVAGFGITRAQTTGWLAIKVNSHGSVDVLTPARESGKGESKDGAVARSLDAFRAAVMEAR